MPEFIITSPEGKKFKISAPEGATPDQVLSFAQSQFSSSPMPAEPASQEPAVSRGRAVLEKGLQGATFGFADELYNRGGAALASAVTGEPYGELLKEATLRTKERGEAQSKQYPGTSALSELGGGILTAAALGVPATISGSAANIGIRGAINEIPKFGAAFAARLGSGGLGAKIAKGALGGAASGALYGAGTAEEGKRGQGALETGAFGGAIGGVFPAAAQAAGYVKNAIAPRVTKGAEEAINYAMKHNIPLSLDQITPGMARKYMTSAAGRVPLSGGDKFPELQQTAFNKAVLKSIGVDGDKITGEIAEEAYNTIGKKFDDVLSGKVLTITPEQKQKILNIYDSTKNTIINEKRNIVKNNVDEILSNFEGDKITGEKIGDLRSEITSRIKEADSGVQPYLRKLLDNIVDISTEGSPEAKTLLKEARYQYKNLKTLEPILVKAENGNINPNLLRERVRNSYGNKATLTDNAGELGELAKVANLMKKKVGDSGTAERAIAYGALGLPAAAIGAYNTPGDVVDKALGGALGFGGAVGLARGYNKYNTSQANILKTIERSKLPPAQKQDLFQRLLIRDK